MTKQPAGKYFRLCFGVIISLFALMLLVQSSASAAPYGQGTYGESLYSADEPTTNTGSGTGSSSSPGSSSSNSSSTSSGTNVPSEETPTEDEGTNTNQASTYSSEESGQNTSESNQAKKDNKNSWVYILVGLISLLLASLLVFFVVKRKKQQNNQPSDYTSQVYTPDQKDKF